MKDAFDNPTGTTSTAAAAHYDRAVDAHLHGWPGALDDIESAIREAPDFALPQALRALVLLGRGQRPQATQSIGEAEARAVSAPPVVRGQIGVIKAMVEGRARDALARVVEHARLHPTDALTASTALGAYGLFAFSGQHDHDAARLAFTESLAPHYPDDFPWLLAYRGWARIETGSVAEGLAMARKAIALRPANGHNAHIVLHGLYESGDPGGSLEFVESWLPSCPTDALHWGHLHWHAALAEIELGQQEAAVARLVGPIADHLPRGSPFMGLADTASLLWRLGLREVQGLPWAMAQAHAARHFPNGGNVFAELHLAMLAAARKDRGALLAACARLRSMEVAHAGATVAVQWTQALLELLDGQRDSAREHFDACLRSSARLGGSNAQRAVLAETLAALGVPTPS